MIEEAKYMDCYGERIANLEQFDKTQITLTNSADEEQWIKVWGANEGNISKVKERSLKTDTYPQAIAYNPFNKLIYVVNQLAANVQMFDEEENLIKSLTLDLSAIPTASPMAIAINPVNGESYVLGSLSDQLYVINANLELTDTIMLQDRPVSAHYNRNNQSLYIQHLIGSSISKVDVTNDYSIELIETGSIQLGLAINSMNSKWAVVSEDGKTIKVLNDSNQIINTFNFENRALSSIVFTEEESELLAIDQESDELLSINITDGSILKSSSFNATLKQLKLTDDNKIVVSTSLPNEIIVLDSNFERIQTIESKSAIADFYYDSSKELVYSVDSIANKVHVLNDTESSPIALFSNNYQEVLADIQHQPVLVKHLKVFYSGINNRPFFRVGFKSSAGKRESRLISLLKYHSPQHYSKIYDVTELDNHIIDGKAFWEVFVPPEQTVSLLIYHE